MKSQSDTKKKKKKKNIFHFPHSISNTCNTFLLFLKYMEWNPGLSEVNGTFAIGFNKDKIFPWCCCDFQPVFAPLILVMTKSCSWIPRMDQHPAAIKSAVVYTFSSIVWKTHHTEIHFALCCITKIYQRIIKEQKMF